MSVRESSVQSDSEGVAPRQAGGVRRGFGVVALVGHIVGRIVLGFAVYFMAMLVLLVAFRRVDPPGSMVMALHRLAGNEVRQTWVPLSAMSPTLVRAVIVSEDGRFCRHWGVDVGEMKAAIERAGDGVPRGASTITMQVAKNLLLWPEKSYVRKALELPLTVMIEAVWSKRRIIEVYLNIAEWGPDVFGAEAGALHHFGKAANRLSEREAALMAVVLPNPIERDAGQPGPGTERLARRIRERMRAMGQATDCLGLGTRR